MPLGAPVLPDVNCTNLPGASRAAGAPEDVGSVKEWTVAGDIGQKGDEPAHRTTDGLRLSRAHMSPIWVRYSSASIPRAGWGNETSVKPERSAPKNVARQSWDAVKRAATVPARPARPSSHAAARRESAAELGQRSRPGTDLRDSGHAPARRAAHRARRGPGSSAADSTGLLRRTSAPCGRRRYPSTGRRVPSRRSDRRTKWNSTSTCPASPGRAAPRRSGRHLPRWPERRRRSACARSR